METDLLGGARTFKDDIRIEICGTIDELSSLLGVVRCAVFDSEVEENLIRLQQKLRQIASELADPAESGRVEKLDPAAVIAMEKEIDCLEESLLPLSDFVLSGPPAGSALLHVARTVARRAERNLVALARRETVNAVVLHYFNRISDYLFLLARLVEQQELVRLVTVKVRKALVDNLGSMGGIKTLMTLEKAKAMIEAAEREAERLVIPVVIAVSDAGGNLVALHRMDGALLVSIELAVNKAYSAVALRMATHELAKLAQPGQSLFGIDKANHGRIVIFGGGMPILSGERMTGGLGVSGGTVEQDMAIANAGVQSLVSGR